MQNFDFAELESVVRNEGGAAAFERLVEKFTAEGAYPAVFETRLMQKRLELGIPALLSGPLEGLPDDVRAEYDRAQVAAARETGELYLRNGRIDRAWPYFRAIGEPGPIREAIERFRAPHGDERIDAVVEIAYHEGVHPARGFELILEHYGTCRAITNFGRYPSAEGREESARKLVDHLYGELRDNLASAIERKEGAAPEAAGVAALIDGRDWLFEGLSYYVDTSHVCSVVQAAFEWEEPEALRKAVELTDYGKRLNEMYQFKGQPPFENLFEDGGLYLRALLGENVEQAVEHFRKKISGEPGPYGDPAAQALVRLLVRLDRLSEAIGIAEEHLADADPNFLECPDAIQLCQLAGDYERMAELGRGRGNPLAFVAGILGARRAAAAVRE